MSCISSSHMPWLEIFDKLMTNKVGEICTLFKHY